MVFSQWRPAHETSGATRIRGASAGMADASMRTDFSVRPSVAQIHLENLRGQLIIRYGSHLPQHLPHRLTGKSEAIDLPGEIPDVVAHVVRLVLRAGRGVFGLVDLRLLPEFPEHRRVWFGRSRIAASKSPLTTGNFRPDWNGQPNQHLPLDTASMAGRRVPRRRDPSVGVRSRLRGPRRPTVWMETQARPLASASIHVHMDSRPERTAALVAARSEPAAA